MDESHNPSSATILLEPVDYSPVVDNSVTHPRGYPANPSRRPLQYPSPIAQHPPPYGSSNPKSHPSLACVHRQSRPSLAGNVPTASNRTSRNLRTF